MTEPTEGQLDNARSMLDQVAARLDWIEEIVRLNADIIRRDLEYAKRHLAPDYAETE